MPKRVIIIGGGVAGLAAAVRLAASKMDLQVTLLEESDHLGGQLQAIHMPHPKRPDAPPFVFDLDPSPLTTPYVILDLFAAAGQDVRDHLKIVKLAPITRYNWPDGTSFDLFDDESQLLQSIAAISKDDLAGWMRLLTDGRRAWENDQRLAERQTKLSGFKDMLTEFGRLGSMLRQALQPSTADRVNRSLVSPKLRQVWHFEIARDTDPWQHDWMRLAQRWLEHEYGVWHIEGGMHRLVDQLETLARKLGVEIRCNCPIEQIIPSDAPRTWANPAWDRGVRLRDGSEILADFTVSLVDPEPHQGRSRLLLGIDADLDLAHHTTLFLDDSSAPSSHVEIACATRTDPSLAPERCHTVVVQAPAQLDSNAIIQLLKIRLRLQDLDNQIVVQRTIPSKGVGLETNAKLAKEILRGNQRFC